MWDEMFIKSLLNDRLGDHDRKLKTKLKNLQAQIDYLDRTNRKWKRSLVDTLMKLPCIASPDGRNDLRISEILGQLSELIPNQRSSRVPLPFDQQEDAPPKEVRYADPRNLNPRQSLLMDCDGHRQSWHLSASEED